MKNPAARSLAIMALLPLLLLLIHSASAQETEVKFLSGHGKDDAVPWKFFCTSGANSGVWTSLPVPSQWDVKGFGTLTYRQDSTDAWNERGFYKHDFAVPASWNGKRVFLVFEGVMTDTTAKLNGESVGPVHQGGFYRFKYEVTKLVKFGANNQLEVDVARHSANESVNKAERLADYWVFAGIYRPVYLEAVPQSFVERVAIDAKADGSFSAKVSLNGVTNAWHAEAQIQTLDGKNIGEPFASGIVDAGTGDNYAQLRTQIPSPKQWTAETPNLYQVEVRLKRGGQAIHTVKQRFGFRTFEVRDGDGLYLNGRKIILKGANRHSFWPDSGRCLSEAVHRLDIETIKNMNGNAVRMSHYPPDVAFLDLCDELGLYVLDELAGWHNYYDTPTGTRLVEAMVTRDVNHPSILFWDNGNEGGFNTDLDNVFARFDPQQRRVLHPWELFSGINTAHYRAYDKVVEAANRKPLRSHDKNAEAVDTHLPNKIIYMPTEFMHGLYDGGAGAGLADNWSLMMSLPNCAGGFIWALLDEGVKRPGTGEIDVAGNQAPDGIVGPYRQPEGSYYTIKEIWSPIQIQRAENGKFQVENHYSFTDAGECRFDWELRKFASPTEKGGHKVLASGKIPGPGIAPGKTGELAFSPSPTPGAEALALRVSDPGGRELWTGVWPLQMDGGQSLVLEPAGQRATVAEADGDIVATAGDLTAKFSRQTGLLLAVKRGSQSFSFANGPRPIVGSAALREIVFANNGPEAIITAQFDGNMKSVRWRVGGNGWIHCDYTYTAAGANDFLGVCFDYPENLVRHKRWLGDGPYRVWQNRLRGVTLGEWENDYNTTIAGYRDWIYPEFKGFFSNVRWMQFDTAEGPFTVVNRSAVPFVQVMTPEFPSARLAVNALAPVPQCGLGFLDVIPPVGNKFKAAKEGGPQGQPVVARGDYSGTVSFYFGKLPPAKR